MSTYQDVKSICKTEDFTKAQASMSFQESTLKGLCQQATQFVQIQTTGGRLSFIPGPCLTTFLRVCFLSSPQFLCLPLSLTPTTKTLSSSLSSCPFPFPCLSSCSPSRQQHLQGAFTGATPPFAPLVHWLSFATAPQFPHYIKMKFEIFSAPESRYQSIFHS